MARPSRGRARARTRAPDVPLSRCAGTDIAAEIRLLTVGTASRDEHAVLGHEDLVFGLGGVQAEAAKLGTPFMGEIPLDIDIRLASDGGAPIVVSKPNSPQAQAFRKIARKMIEDGQA